MKLKKYLPLAFLFLLVLFCFAACGEKVDGMNYKAVEGGYAITGYTDKTSVTEITVPDEIEGLPVIRIDDFGICNAESLKKITIGKNVKELGGWALTNNQHLTEFVVDPENRYFTAVDGVLFTKDMTVLVAYPSGRGISFDQYGRAENAVEYAIPEGVQIIDTKAFYKCGHVNITSFPSTLTHICEKAFFKCYYREEFTKDHIVESGLTDFTLPEGVVAIEKDAFAYDELLTEVTLPSTLKEVGDFAFFNCKQMKKLTVNAKESDLTLGEKWQPTAKGKIIEDCEVVFAK